MSTEQQQKAEWIDKTYITSAGDEVVIRHYLCHRCNQYMRSQGHPQCAKDAEQEKRIEEWRINKEIREKEDIFRFGEIIYDEKERYMRLNPDFRDTRTNKSWNMMLDEKEAKLKQEYFDRQAARISRKERALPDAEQQYKYLQAQVKIDEQEQFEDDKAEEARLKEHQKQ